LKLTKDTNNDGTVSYHFVGDAERYLALNASSGNDYFAWYKSGQKQNLTLIPVGGSVETPTEPEATEPEATEPEATEPEATEPEATEPEATEPEATEPAVDEPAEESSFFTAILMAIINFFKQLLAYLGL
jgi:hypothetical protein